MLSKTISAYDLSTYKIKIEPTSPFPSLLQTSIPLFNSSIEELKSGIEVARATQQAVGYAPRCLQMYPTPNVLNGGCRLNGEVLFSVRAPSKSVTLTNWSDLS